MSNKNIEIVPFVPADEIIISGNRERTDSANLNQVSGPAYTVLLKGKPIASGGLRIHGICEAFFMMSKEAEKEHLKTVMEQCKKKLEEMQRQEKIYQMYARCDISENFLEHLGFEKVNDIFVR